MSKERRLEGSWGRGRAGDLYELKFHLTETDGDTQKHSQVSAYTGLNINTFFAVS